MLRQLPLSFSGKVVTKSHGDQWTENWRDYPARLVVCAVQLFYTDPVRTILRRCTRSKSMRFGERDRALRPRKGWRLLDLTERVSVGHTHLSRGNLPLKREMPWTSKRNKRTYAFTGGV